MSLFLYISLSVLSVPVIYYNNQSVRGELVLNAEGARRSFDLVCRVEAHPIPAIVCLRNDSSPPLLMFREMLNTGQ